MAIARPVRALGLTAVVLWCFFVWQLFKPIATPTGPNANSFLPKERDPNLDRKHTRKYGMAIPNMVR
jgi:mannosyltransferase